MSKPLVFFGTEDFSAVCLTGLIGDGLDVKLVVTKPDAPAGRGRELRQPKVKAIADKACIEVIQPVNLRGSIDKIKNISEWAVLVSYGKIVPQEIIDLFSGGIVNVHPSLLPKYRGPAPIEAAILNGDKTTGITLMKLSAKMDAGPIYCQLEVPITGAETKPELYDSLAKVGSNYLLSQLPQITEGDLLAHKQIEANATYTKLLSKADSVIDWSKPAEVIERSIRAHLGYPKSRTNLFGAQVIILQARVAKDAQDGPLVKQCGEGYLEIQQLTAPSGRTMSGGDFLRGYAKR